MARFFEVDPETFIVSGSGIPANGRGAWTKRGIDFDYRYALSAEKSMRIGRRAEVSLDHWAVSIGCYAIQRRLADLGHMTTVSDANRGLFGPRTRDGVIAFQKVNSDPDGGAKLVTDGTVGRSDGRALFTPLVLAAEEKYEIPGRFLLGETNHESRMDPGALGYFIYYPDYRGVDRGMSQINSRYNPQVSWEQAFDPVFSLDWSAKRMRDFFDKFKSKNPKRSDEVLWDAAICAHNNPAAASDWAEMGVAPHAQAATYVSSVKAAIF